jgi:hypothetical protein
VIIGLLKRGEEVNREFEAVKVESQLNVLELPEITTIKEYADDLRGSLETSSIMEQRSFLSHLWIMWII